MESSGKITGKAGPCPQSPNCVSSLAKDSKHFMEPLRYEGPKAGVKERILKILSTMPRTRIISSEGDYIHAEVTSAVFRFVDDVEFFLGEEEGVVHFRSASRTGYWDFGVNRKRMERFRRLF